MYLDYFGLKEKPFTISPDPRYLYMSEYHREALAHLLYGISSDGCLILLTGDVGTGKTTVCRSLLALLPDNTETAIIVNPKLSVQELLETICEELGIPYSTNSASIKSYIDGINNYLLQSHAQGKTTALIIDEAQNLDMDVLEQLRLLTNLETDTAKLLKIVLIGQPELQDKLRDPKVAQIDQRITSRYHLAPLSRSDVFRFIQHRLVVAGGGRMKFFSDKALEQAYLISKGIPRIINILCDRALLGAFVEEKDQVTEDILLRAGREILGETTLPEKRKPARFAYMTLFFALLLLSLGTTTYMLFSGGANPFKNFFEDSALFRQHKLSSSHPDSPQRNELSPQAKHTNEIPLESEVTLFNLFKANRNVTRDEIRPESEATLPETR
jgi:general secretion pathway protein A